MESLGGLLFPLLILLVFVPIFLSGRKQRRQMQEMQQLQGSLEVGDIVTTTSGLRGTVVDVSYEETVDLEIADDVITTWLRVAVRDKVADSSAGAIAADAELAPEAAPPLTGTDGASIDGPDGRTPSGARADVVADPADASSDANGSTRP
jgi:preprotein translocase subunit YajC